MSEHESPEVARADEAQEAAQAASPAVRRPTAHVIRAQHASNGFLGPFASREEAEAYLAAKRAVAYDDKWEEGRVKIVSAEEAHRERDEERARELMRR
jgi:hypothetical protein